MRRCKIGDFLDNYGDGIHGTPTYDEKGDIYFINGNNLQDGMVVLSNNIPRITQEEYQKIARPLTEKTILLSINGTLGNIAIYNNEKIALGKSVCFLNIKEDKNLFYIKYVLSTQEFKKYMFLVAHGSTIKNLAPSQVADYEFVALNTKMQNHVASLLKSIDDKITLNNRLNAMLEEMAKTLYDYWFVQFDFPDEKGRPYKTSGGKMVYNEELGREIPAGWEVKRVSEISNISVGGDCPNSISNIKTDKYNIPIFANGRVNEGLYGFTDKYTVEEDSITISARGSIGYATIRKGGFVPIIRLLVVTPRDKIYLKFIEEFFSGYTYRKNGSVQQQFTVPQVEMIKILVPSHDILQKYHILTSSIVAKTFSITEENRHLATLRDWLLPMLMNGQVGFRRTNE